MIARFAIKKRERAYFGVKYLLCVNRRIYFIDHENPFDSEPNYKEYKTNEEAVNKMQGYKGMYVLFEEQPEWLKAFVSITIECYARTIKL